MALSATRIPVIDAPRVSSDKARAIYVAPTAPKYEIRKVDIEGDKRRYNIKFENGQYATDNPAIAKALDELIETKPHISSMVRKLDREAARRVSENFMRLQRERNRGVTGSVSSADTVRLLANERLDNRDAELLAAGIDPATVNQTSEAIRAADMQLTNRTSDIAREGSEGFKADNPTNAVRSLEEMLGRDGKMDPSHDPQPHGGNQRSGENAPAAGTTMENRRNMDEQVNMPVREETTETRNTQPAGTKLNVSRPATTVDEAQRGEAAVDPAKKPGN